MSDDLINHLVLNLRPVRRLHSPLKRLMAFSASGIASTAAILLSLRFRVDLLSRFHDRPFLAETAVVLVLSLSAAFAALRRGIPGEKSGSASWLALLALLMWLLLNANHARFCAIDTRSGLSCVRRTLLFCIPPTLALFAMLKRSAPLDVRECSALALVSAASLGVFGTRFVCSREDSVHVLLWHIAPVACLALFGWLLGRLLLPKPSARISGSNGA